MNCTAMSLCAGGPTLSRVIAGMWRMAEWQLDVPARVRLIEECLDLGVTTFDHADIYGNYTVEALFGEALKSQPALKQKIQIVSKCGIKLPGIVNGVPRLAHYDLGAQHIQDSVNSSLTKLGVEALDVLLLHRPSPLMDFDEMAEVLKQLRAAGKVLHVGVSNFTRVQFEALNKRIPLVTNQVEFSPLNLQVMDNGVMDGLQDHGVVPMIWSALAGGSLFTQDTPQLIRIRAALADIAHELKLTPAAVVYAWIMRLPCRPVLLTGSRRIEIIREAVAATEVNMDLELWFMLLKAIRGADVP